MYLANALRNVIMLVVVWCVRRFADARVGASAGGFYTQIIDDVV